MASELDNLAPNFEIKIEGQKMGPLSDLVQSLEYESVDGMADALKLKLMNPYFKVTDMKAFSVGNEISVWFGYGVELKHVGRATVVKEKPDFSQSQAPSLEVVAYTRDHRMMDTEPEQGQDRRFFDTTYDAVASAVAFRLGMETDIDVTDQVVSFFQKAGMSDYDLVKGLANITGYLFWVDGDEDGVWTLHFRSPDNPVEQERRYTFVYNDGDNGTLLSFNPQMLLAGAATKLRVQAKNTITGELFDEELEIEDEPAEVVLTGDLLEEMLEPATSAEAVKLFIGDYSFQVVPSKRFRNAAEARLWAEQWFRRTRENFVMAKGRIIGVEDLMARQTHELAGIGKYSGEYYFTRVRHVLNSSTGYVCDFDARKVL